MKSKINKFFISGNVYIVVKSIKGLRYLKFAGQFWFLKSKKNKKYFNWFKKKQDFWNNLKKEDFSD